jgi:hypothetical protein
MARREEQLGFAAVILPRPERLGPAGHSRVYEYGSQAVRPIWAMESRYALSQVRSRRLELSLESNVKRTQVSGREENLVYDYNRSPEG